MPEAEVDVQLGPIMAGVRAELSILNAHNAARQSERDREAARAKVPATVRQFASVVIPTPTARVGFGFPGPRAGFYWMVRRLVIGGVTWKTSAAGTAEVYVTGLPSGAIAGLQLGDLVDEASASTPALPSVAFYSDQQIVIQAGEHLEVVIDTGTAGQLYVASCQIQAFRTIAAEIEFST